MKNGKNPENKPIRGTIIRDSLAENIKLVKNNMVIMMTNIILGIKEEIVRPYNDVTNPCLRLGFISSKVIFRIIMAVIKPTENNQKRILMVFLRMDKFNDVVIFCSQ